MSESRDLINWVLSSHLSWVDFSQVSEYSKKDILTVQELPGHNDIKTTMIYTHVLNRGPAGARNPVDEV